jgi:glucosamine 6-phosphate synthetase-like amidotransferase/phosphosugar isomerase protein
LADEVALQPRALDRFSAQRFAKARKGSIFVGAGDSYAAALAAFYASRGELLALDPYVLASNPEFADGADVYFISISGRTSSNALAAKKVRGRARRLTAITAVTDSRLAGLADRVVELPMSFKPRTPGMLSFSLSLVAVMMISGVDGRSDFAGAFREAKKDRLGLAGKSGTTYYLGNALAFPVALYAAEKTYEILGAKAHAELLEEFSHLEVFSLRKADRVNGFACFDPDGLAGKLGRALTSRGYDCRAVRSWGDSAMERLFHAVFAAQLSILRAAEAKGITAPKFLFARGALETSDAMIY